MKVSPARKAALNALEKYRRQGTAPADSLNDEVRKSGLDKRDAALAMRLCYGVLQNMMYCDYCIDVYSSRNTNLIEPKVRDILRLSVYQILFADKIPVSAAVNEGVEICRLSGRRRACGFVNAVLRCVAEKNIPDLPGKNTEEFLSVKYSYPRQHVKDLVRRIGFEETEKLFAFCNEPAAVSAQINTLKTSADLVLEEFSGAAHPHPWLQDCVEIIGAGDISLLPAYREGKFYIQDAAARLAVTAASPLPGMNVLDACSAPGGKSFAAAIMMKNRGRILACDKNANRLNRVSEGAGTLGFSIIETKVLNAEEPGEVGSFDLVIADAPCSGFGTIRKKPEIRYKSPGDIEKLPDIQTGILNGLKDCVTDGGVLLYSVCTFRTEENESVVNRFIKDNPNFVPEGFSLPKPIGDVGSGIITIWPHLFGTDGFFICKLRKIYES